MKLSLVVPCYNEAENVTILVDREQNYAKVTTATASADIKLPIGMWGAGISGRFYLTDVTGDGRKELIYECGAGGTGVWEGSINIYDTLDMSEYYIDKNFVYDLEKQVALEALYMDTENSALCRVTGPKEFSNYLYVEAYQVEAAKPEEFRLEPDEKSSHLTFSVVENESDGGATASIEVEVAIPYPEIVGYGIYVGEVTDTLVYDADKNIFRLAGNAEFSQDDRDWVVDIGFSHFNGSDKVYIYEDWKITVNNKFKHENIEQFYFMGFLEQNDSGEWEYLDCLMDFSRLEHVIPSESLIEIEMKPEWFKDIKADSHYTAAFKCNLKVVDGQYEEVWFYKDVYVSK